jgi:hypothetical protein
MSEKMTPNERMMSLLSDRQALPTAPLGGFGSLNAYSVGVARVRMEAGRARTWRITLGRLDRADGAWIAQGSNQLFAGQNYQYINGIPATGAIPPRRAMPIFGSGDPSNGATLQQQWVEIAWGTLGGAAPNRLLAHWPMLGGSLVVSGTYVEVWGASAINFQGTPPVIPGSVPVYQAQIDPWEGESSIAGDELSLTDSGPIVEPLVGGEWSALPDGGFVNGFLVFPDNGLGSFAGSRLKASAVQNVAPFTDWDAVLIRKPFLAPTMPLVTFYARLAGAACQVLDNSSVDFAGTVTASPGNVAVLINIAAPCTFLQLETAINTSAIVMVKTPSTNPAHIIANAAAPNSCWGQVAAPAAPGIPNAHAAVAGRPDLFPDFLSYLSSIPPVVEGAIFYVPDFARRVRVSVTRPRAGEPVPGELVPVNADPQASITFWDERGQVIHGYRQGLILNGAAIVGNNPPEFQPVPDNAVMMSVLGDPAVLDASAFVHWRISP